MKRCECGCGRVVRLAPYTSKARGWVAGQPIRYVHGHHARKKSPEYVEEDRGYKTPCWIWQRAVMKPRGYGVTTVNSKSAMAHRVYYERFVKPIPKGLHIDHLCGVTACVNPDHLEPVSCKENLRRGKGTKFSIDEVREIVMRHLNGETAISLGAEYGCDARSIHAMARGAEAILTWP